MASLEFSSLASFLNEFHRRWKVAGWENRGIIASSLLRECRPDLFREIGGTLRDPWGQNERLGSLFQWLAIKWFEEQAPEGPAWSYGEPRVPGMYFVQHRAAEGADPLPVASVWQNANLTAGYNRGNWRWFGPVDCPESDEPWPEEVREPSPTHCGCGNGKRFACSTFTPGSSPQFARGSVQRIPSPEEPCLDCGHREMCHRRTAETVAPAEPEEDSATNQAVRELLFLVAIEGISKLSRGGKGCVFRAVEALRPDIAKQWENGAEPSHLLGAYFPDAEDGKHHVLIMGKHSGRPIGCMAEPSPEDFRHAAKEDPGVTFVPVPPEECPVCGPKAEG